MPKDDQSSSTEWPRQPIKTCVYDLGLANAIADAIDINLDRYFASTAESYTFVDDASRVYPSLYDHRNIEDRSLRAAWVFADSFFDAASEGFNDLDRVPWPEAVRLLNNVLRCLRSGAEITESVVLRYADI